MNTMEAIRTRHSYRGKFLSTPIPREHLIQILEAGFHAPSGCNKQTTSFLAVDDPQIMQQLHAVIDPPVGETAPAMICVLTQKIIAYRDRTFYVQDYAAAIENMLLAIVELGYASCWIEGHITDIDRIGDQMARILKIPEEYELVAFLSVGIPAQEVRPVAKQPFAQRVWLNGFGKSVK